MSYRYGPTCYSVWRSTNRCRNCTSLRALKTGRELRKTEVKDGDLYYITSRPIEILREDGTVFPCVIEMIRMEKGKGMRQDEHHAVLQQVEDLTKLGCNIFQGFYFAQPVPVAAYLERFGEEKAVAAAES